MLRASSQAVFAFLCLLGLTVFLPTVCFAQDDPKITRFKIDEAVADWILDEKTGRIFASLSGGDKVVEFSRESGKELRRFEVGGNCRQMLIKGDYLVVAAKSGVSLYVINLKTNEVAGRVALEGDGPYAMFCSKADNPYVYAICNTGDAWWDGELFQVNVEELKTRNRAAIQGWRESGAQHVAISPDGKFAVADQRPGTSPSGAGLMAVNEDEFEFANSLHIHDSFGVITAGPNNRFWTLGNLLIPIDFQTTRVSRFGDPNPIREFAGSPVTIHPKQDLVASMSREREGIDLKIQSFSTAKNLSTIPLGQIPGEDDRSSIFGGFAATGFSDDPTIQFDAEGKYLFFGYGKLAAMVQLESLGLPDQPLVILQMPREITTTVNEQMRLPVAFTDPALLESAVLEVANGPETVSADAGQLVWTPAEADIGWHNIKLLGKVGDAEDAVDIRIKVERPSLDVGVVYRKVAVDAAGRRALVLGMSQEEIEKRREGYPDDDETSGELVLVDLENKSEIARRKLSKSLREIYLTETAAYIAPSEGTAIHSLKLDDLSDDKRAFLQAMPLGFESLPGDRLVVETENGVEVFSETDLKREDSLPYMPSFNREFMMRGEVEQGRIEKLIDGVRFGNLVLNPETGEPQLLISSIGLPELNPLQPESPPSRWNRRVAPSGIYAHGNTPISTWNYGPSLLLTDFPAAVTVNSAQMDGDRQTPSTVQLSLVFRGLIEGAQLSPIQLATVPNTGRDPYDEYGGAEVFLAEAGNRMLVAYRSKLMLVDKPLDELAELQEPIRFVPRQRQMVARVGDTPAIRFEAAGGNGEPTFDLIADFPGSNLDTVTGELTIDTSVVWEAMKEKLQQQFAQWGGGRGRGPLSEDSFVEPARQRYRQLMQEPTVEFPFAVNLKLSVTDEEGESDRISSQFVLLAPREEVDQLIAAAVAESAVESAENTADAAPVDSATANSVSTRQLEAVLAEMARAIAANNRDGAALDQIENRLSALAKDVREMRQDQTNLADSDPGLDDRLNTLDGDVDARFEKMATQIDSIRDQSSTQQTVLLITMIVMVVFLAANSFSLVLLWRKRPQ